MNRRAVLTVFAFLAAGVLVAEFAIQYLHQSPSPIFTSASAESGASPIVDLNLTTVGAVGTGDHPNWVGYLPTTFFKVPPNAIVKVTIDQQDSASGARNPYLGLVRGTVDPNTGQVDNLMSVKRDVDKDAKSMQVIDPSLAAHSFSVPDLGVSVPLLGTDPNNSKNTDNFITFYFKVPASGIFHWQCFVPCGAGTLYGNGGPMQTLGYMDGQIEVQS